MNKNYFQSGSLFYAICALAFALVGVLFFEGQPILVPVALVVISAMYSVAGKIVEAVKENEHE